MKEREAIIDEGEVEEDAGAGEAVTPMAGDFGAALRVVAIEAGENLVVREGAIFRRGDALRRPCAFDAVVVLGRV